MHEVVCRAVTRRRGAFVSHAIRIPGGVLCFSDTGVVCPHCAAKFEAEAYDERLQKSKRGYLHINCPACQRRVGLTADMRGDLVCFDLHRRTS